MAKIIERHADSEDLFFFLRDTGLSLKAKGLLSQVFIYGTEHFNSIDALNSEGSSAKSNLLKELEAKGYLVREREKEKMQFGDIKYHFGNKPIFLNDKAGE